MLLRKFNAGLSLLITFLLLDHAIFYSIWMISRGTIEKSVAFMPWVLIGLTILHACIGIYFAVTGIRDSAKNKGKKYPKLNKGTIIQRITSLLMCLLIGLHIAGAANHFQPQILHAVIHPLFFATVLVHVAVSTSKALITLGIGNAKFVKTVDVIVKGLCGATFIASVIGFYLCLFMGVVK